MCRISLRIFLDGSRGVISLIEKSFFQKNIRRGTYCVNNLQNVKCPGARNGSPWLATGSRWVEMNRTASRKLFRHLPGPKTATKSVPPGIFVFVMGSRRPGRCLKSFLEAVRIFWTHREPVASHGDPIRDHHCVLETCGMCC